SYSLPWVFCVWGAGNLLGSYLFGKLLDISRYLVVYCHLCLVAISMTLVIIVDQTSSFDSETADEDEANWDWRVFVIAFNLGLSFMCGATAINTSIIVIKPVENAPAFAFYRFVNPICQAL